MERAAAVAIDTVRLRPQGLAFEVAADRRLFPHPGIAAAAGKRATAETVQDLAEPGNERVSHHLIITRTRHR
jgi:hypothetical protein